MKVLELFSGIGGMHLALQGEFEAEVLAVEINPNANAVYRQNFPSSNLMQKNILSVSSKETTKFGPQMLLMSPPCQPFTRVGLKKDLNDARTDPLKHILTLLPELTSLMYILVENVKGFETSDARNNLVTCLEDLQFRLQEFLLTPTQIGVPNMRTRYYLLAKRQPLEFNFVPTGITEKLPDEFLQILNAIENQFPEFSTVEDILETDDVTSDIFQDHLLPDKLVEKRSGVMDIVCKDSSKTCCFTKAYSHYVEGTGSIYCPYDRGTLDKAFFDRSALKALNLRYFTPREVARLMSFPDNFTFPATMTRKQKYRLLGNSVNVKMVALLIRLMVCEPHR